MATVNRRLLIAACAVGTQDYVCLPAGDGVKFTPITPQATLSGWREQITTHYFGPNPAEGGTIPPTSRRERSHG